MEQDLKDWERNKLEYQMAQEMIRHYDILNWQIGAILIAGVFVLTAFVLRSDIFDLARLHKWTSFVLMVLAIPAFSAIPLVAWRWWFMRHRALYNFRNEVLQRIELKEGMYHYLRVAEARLQDSKENKEKIAILQKAKERAGYGSDPSQFAPLFDLGPLKGFAGHKIALFLVIGVPLGQLILLLFVWRASQSF
jgi:hypothetical protein